MCHKAGPGVAFGAEVTAGDRHLIRICRRERHPRAAALLILNLRGCTDGKDCGTGQARGAAAFGHEAIMRGSHSLSARYPRTLMWRAVGGHSAVRGPAEFQDR